MSKGSGRRNEDAQKVRDNWELAFGKKEKEPEQKKEETNDDKK